MNNKFAAIAVVVIGMSIAPHVFPQVTSREISSWHAAILDEEVRRQDERRVRAYERLRGKLDTSLNASAEARNLAVGSALQIVTPLTEMKAQQLQQRRMYR